MKIKLLLAFALLAGSTMFAGGRVFVGVGFGAPLPYAYAPYPYRVAYAPPPPPATYPETPTQACPPTDPRRTSALDPLNSRGRLHSPCGNPIP